MSDRPDPLSVAQVAELLRAFPAVLEAEVWSLPPDVLRWHPAPGEWCVPEALGHLIETEERAFVGRIQTILGGETRFRPYDEDAAAALRDCGADVSALLGRFATLREAGVALAVGLSDGDLDLGGWHDEIGRVTVRELLHEWVFHDRDHLRQIMANAQGYLWDQLGNTRAWYTRPGPPTSSP